MMPWTFSGSGLRSPRSREHVDELLGVERVAAGPLSRAAWVAAGARARAGAHRRAVSSSDSGGSDSVEALRLPPPHAGRRSSSSGRAVQTTSSGTLPAQSTRWSTKSSRLSSAQCRSSKTSTSGSLARPAPRRTPPGGEARAGRLELAGEADQRSQVRPTRRSASTSRRPRRRASPSASSAASVSRMPHWALTISPSAQKVTPSPYGEAATLAPDDDRSGARRRTARTRGRVGSCRSRARRGSSRAARSRRERARSAARSARVPRSRPTSGALSAPDVEPSRARGSTPPRRRPARPSPSPHRLGLPVLEHGARRAVGVLADEDAVTGAADCSRAAVLTTSPAAMLSPGVRGRKRRAPRRW